VAFQTSVIPPKKKKKSLFIIQGVDCILSKGISTHTTVLHGLLSILPNTSLENLFLHSFVDLE